MLPHGPLCAGLIKASVCDIARGRNMPSLACATTRSRTSSLSPSLSPSSLVSPTFWALLVFLSVSMFLSLVFSRVPSRVLLVPLPLPLQLTLTLVACVPPPFFSYPNVLQFDLYRAGAGTTVACTCPTPTSPITTARSLLCFPDRELSTWGWRQRSATR